MAEQIKTKRMKRLNSMEFSLTAKGFWLWWERERVRKWLYVLIKKIDFISLLIWENRTSTGCKLFWHWFRALLRCFNGYDQGWTVSISSTAMGKLRRRWRCSQWKCILNCPKWNWWTFRSQSTLITLSGLVLFTDSFTHQRTYNEIGSMNRWKLPCWKPMIELSSIVNYNL